MLADRYVLDEELGRSGTGMVWRATDTLLERVVAVKLVRPELGDDPCFADSLAEQVRRVASLSAPALAQLLDTGEQDGVVYIVREHVEGTSARALLEREGPLPTREAARIALLVLAGLAAAHDAGVYHLDLELDDVLLGAGGDVRVTDLGIGAAVHASRPPVEAVRLLGDHLPPEVPPDARADVFAVGALLFELLTGAVPGGGTSPRALRADVPRELDRAVAEALDPTPGSGFADVRAFASALEPFARPPGTTSGRRPAVRVAWMRAWLAAPLAVVGAAAALIGIGLWLGGLEVGGPLGIRPAEQEEARVAPAPPPVPREIAPVAVSVLDPPPGDGHENDRNLGLAADGEPTSVWRSENYFDGRLNKPGVGLVFDLGRSMRVTGFRILTPHPGYTVQVAIGDDAGTLPEAVGEPLTTTAETVGSVEGLGRYVLLWITSVVPTQDGNRAEVAEFVVEVVGDA